MALSYTMDKIGPITRSADDCDLVLKVISGHDAEDLGSLPEAAAKYPGAAEVKGNLRVGWLVNQWKELSPDVNQPVMAARQVLEKSPSIDLSNSTLPEGSMGDCGRIGGFRGRRNRIPDIDPIRPRCRAD